MKRLFGKLFLFIILPLLSIPFLAPRALATTVVMLSDKEMVVHSRLIVTGVVRSVVTAWDDGQEMVWTYVEIRCDRVLKGELAGKRIVLKQMGGLVGESGVKVFGQPDFLPGERLLLFLNTGPDGSLHVAHAFMGMFFVTGDDRTGKELVRRRVATEGIQVLVRRDNEAVTDQAYLEDYIRKVEETLESEAVSIAEIEAGRAGEPLILVPGEYDRKKRESQGYSPSYTFMGNGVRWMQADSGQPIGFNVNPTSSPISGGGVAELTRGLEAWPSQSGANIRLQISGQTSSCGYDADGSNTVSFGDCRNQLDSPVGCSGVVAQTRILYFSDTKLINGKSFNRLHDADVIFNKGMDCFLRNSANLAEIACHEFGHAIGLGHSDDPAAIMWATAHGGDRDAVLGADDRAGVLAIYPASSGGGGPISITSFALMAGTQGRLYRHQLTATGGTPPYRWSAVSALPPGLTLTQGGSLEGTPHRGGSYSFGVQVFDSSGTFDSRQLTLTVLESESLPVITGVRVKGSKKFFVFGENFVRGSLIILNGLVLTPKSVEINGNTGRLYYKGRLRIGPAGSNTVQVVDNNNRSSPFVF